MTDITFLFLLKKFWSSCLISGTIGMDLADHLVLGLQGTLTSLVQAASPPQVPASQTFQQSPGALYFSPQAFSQSTYQENYPSNHQNRDPHLELYETESRPKLGKRTQLLFGTDASVSTLLATITQTAQKVSINKLAGLP